MKATVSTSVREAERQQEPLCRLLASTPAYLVLCLVRLALSPGSSIGEAEGTVEDAFYQTLVSALVLSKNCWVL